MESISGFKAGLRVRIKRNPSRVGRLTGETETRGVLTRWEVDFANETEFVTESALEVVASETPFDRLRNGRYDRTGSLRIAMTYNRLSGRLAELIYSLNTTRTDLLAYQFKPLLALLESPCRGVLIADEVGLGKTIEAGLIWTELRVRENARRLLIVCPAMLREKWKRELADKFGVTSEICDASELLERLEETKSGRREDFAIIASLQGLRTPRDWSEEAQASSDPRSALSSFLYQHRFDEKLFDLVVIDEAHYLRNAETRTSRFGELLRPTTEWIALLSATPIQLRNRDLFQLLHLLDEAAFPNEYAFELITREAAPLVRLRDAVMRSPMGIESFRDSLQEAIDARINLPSHELLNIAQHLPTSDELQDPRSRVILAERLDAISPLNRIINRTRKRDVQTNRVIRKAATIAASMTAEESGLYTAVTERIRQYCVESDQNPGLLITIPQRQLCSSMPAAYRKWMVRGVNDISNEELWEASGEPAAGETENISGPLIGEMSAVAMDGLLYGRLKANDSKWNKLWPQLNDYWRANPDSKVVLFSTFKATLYYLQERFSEQDIYSIVLVGGVDKDACLQKFESDKRARILLSSEVASEGVDLQFCQIVVNYDLPWNPMRIEQRIGRIDRIGQKAASIVIWNLMYADTLDDRVYRRLLSRIGVFTTSLGGTEEILGNPIAEMTRDLFSQRLTPEQEEARIEQTLLSMERMGMEQQRLEEESGSLLAHGDWIQAKIDIARDLGRYVRAQDLYQYVREFFSTHYPGSQFILKNEEKLQAEADLSSDARIDFNEYLERNRLQRRSALASPTSARTEVRFDNQVGGHGHKPEVISQYHPIIRFITENLRANEKNKSPSVAACRVAATAVAPIAIGTYVYAVARMSFSGDHDSESLVYSASLLQEPARLVSAEDSERLVLAASANGEEWMGARNLPGDLVRDISLDCVQEIETRTDTRFEVLEQRSIDRLEVQQNLAKRNAENIEHRLVEQIRRLRETKSRALPLFEAQLVKHKAKTESIFARLERKQQPTKDLKFVVFGVIEVF